MDNCQRVNGLLGRAPALLISVVVDLPDEMIEALRACAESEGITVGSLCRRILTRAVKPQ